MTLKTMSKSLSNYLTALQISHSATSRTSAQLNLAQLKKKKISDKDMT